MTPENPIQLFATICFGLALLHTFSVKRFQHLACQFHKNSWKHQIFHLLGDVELVFGIWASIFILGWTAAAGISPSAQYLASRSFSEPIFVFVALVICATPPVLRVATFLIQAFSQVLCRALFLNRSTAFYVSTLTVGPLLGSLITEPAAMTVTALILLKHFYERGISPSLKYATLGLLFVNVSIGGTLTPFAAPPILMVARPWGWDLAHMLTHFGWKSALAVTLSTAIVTWRFRKELARIPRSSLSKGSYSSQLRMTEALKVASFLAGLVVLGEPQRWWLEPVLVRLEALPLFLGAISLTAITDNAALTYLGSQVPSLSEASRYALVAGAVTGGGLTVIANAPNPAGYSILNDAFGREGISPIALLLSALPPTAVAALCLWFL